MREVLHRHDQELALRIPARARPVRAAAGERVQDRAALARRREEPLVAQPRELLAARREMLRSRRVEVLLAEALRHQRRRRARERLRRPAALARHVARGERPLLDREERRAGLAVEHEHEAALGGLRHRVARAALALERDQDRRRGEVVVPEIVVDGLEVPAQLARARRRAATTRVGVEVRAGAVAAVEVGARRADGQEHEAAREIGGDRGPDVGGAGARGAALPGLVSRLARARDGVEGPAQRAAAHVEGAHVAGRRVRAQRVGDRRADHDHVADHRAGEVTLYSQASCSGAMPASRSTRARGREVGARLAGRRVEGDQPRVERARGRRARRRRPSRLGSRPVGDAAVDPHVRVVRPRSSCGSKVQSSRSRSRDRARSRGWPAW